MTKTKKTTTTAKPRKKHPVYEGEFRAEFEKNKRRILLTQDICGICGKPVDKNLKYPHPLSPTIDHIIPINRGGHPAHLDNLQLAHFTCNRMKSDKVLDPVPVKKDPDKIGNRVLPLSMDWTTYRAG